MTTDHEKTVEARLENIEQLLRTLAQKDESKYRKISVMRLANIELLLIEILNWSANGQIGSIEGAEEILRLYKKERLDYDDVADEDI